MTRNVSLFGFYVKYKNTSMLSRIIVLVVAGVAVVYIVRFIDNFLSRR